MLFLHFISTSMKHRLCSFVQPIGKSNKKNQRRHIQNFYLRKIRVSKHFWEHVQSCSSFKSCTFEKIKTATQQYFVWFTISYSNLVSPRNATSVNHLRADMSMASMTLNGLDWTMKQNIYEIFSRMSIKTRLLHLGMVKLRSNYTEIPPHMFVNAQG